VRALLGGHLFPAKATAALCRATQETAGSYFFMSPAVAETNALAAHAATARDCLQCDETAESSANQIHPRFYHSVSLKEQSDG
jgi:hypothetical protein